MKTQKQIIQRLVEKDQNSLNELYDTYIFHLSRLLTNSGTDPNDHEQIITHLFHMIWSSPSILSQEKHFSIAITKLCLTLSKAPFATVSSARG
ncbi:hypothetical protein [Pseudalkalibacillus hwajinpoensis]|uniref:hypothetical protein n=1 Tax=Guptibacillus hwajinpoensis TaxID=208199 RepID=UPI001CD6DBFF|nr:hypothetical protein [Pseudalkalibacillus hwajinpoensis]MCA0992083.1 hypothetical protein [Pseudalkalibacillus hwajinpoensis]